MEEEGRRNGLWLFLLFRREFIYWISTLSDHRVMRIMWLRYPLFSARLFESHRMTCYSIEVEGESRVKRWVLLIFLS